VRSGHCHRTTRVNASPMTLDNQIAPVIMNIDVTPTIARLLGVDFKTADGKVVTQALSGDGLKR